VIKHRFILRGEDDFRIFAAIPVERTVLTWQRRPARVDVSTALEAARACLTINTEYKSAIEALRAAIIECRSVVDKRDAQLADHSIHGPLRRALDTWAPITDRVLGLADTRIRQDDAFISAIPQHTPEQLAYLFIERLEWEREGVREQTEQRHTYFGTIEDTANRLLQHAPNGKLRPIAVAFVLACQKLRLCARHGAAVHAAANFTQLLQRALDTEFNDAVCPEGVPFACYTVELHDVVVYIVEGFAWVHSDTDLQPRALTEDEKRVVEIVSQMLTERALNPKADTRIPVVPVDPAHERDVRAAEDRDAKAPPKETRLRTIKFTVSPPRYLRAAAERILSSPRRAHWVVGHWRDQPYGTAHQLRRQTWIKPHIRGLGEAGAITARVAAPDEETARKDPKVTA
jgi:hypothetical protein